MRITPTILILLILLPVALSESEQAADGIYSAYRQFHLNEGTGGTTDDTGSFNTDGSFSGTWATGKFGAGVNTNNAKVTTTSSMSNDNTWSAAMWLKPNVDVGTSSWGLFNGYSGSNTCTGTDCSGMRWNYGPGCSAGKLCFHSDTGTPQCQVASVSTTWSQDVWYHVAGTVNSSHICIYINGVVDNCNAVGGSTCNAGFTQNFAIGAWTDSSSTYFDGIIDEFHLWTDTLTPSQIYSLYTNPVSWVPPTPDNNSVTSVNVTVNCTTILSNTNVTMLQDDEIMRLGIAPDTNGNYVNFTTNFTGEILHNYTCAVYDLDSTLWTNITRFISTDLTRPFANATNFPDNNTVIGDPEDPYFIANLTYEDTNLFAFETWLDNTLLLYNQSGITNPYYQNFSLRVTNLSGGRHFINFSVFDGHTRKLIEDEDIDRNFWHSKVKLSKRNTEDNWVEIEALDNPHFQGELSVERRTDRYTFNYHKGDNRQTLRFLVTSPSPIVVINDGRYRGWLVIPELKRWVDFETVQSIGNIDVRQLSDTEVEVTVHGVTDDDIIFESTGYVNVNWVTGDFYVANWTAGYEPVVLTSSVQEFNMSVDVNGTLTVNASFHYNGVLYNVTRGEGNNFSTSVLVPTVAGNYTFNWTLNFSDGVFNQAFDLNFTQEVTTSSLDNCTTAGWQKTLTFCAFNEENGTNITPYDLNINLYFAAPGQTTPYNAYFEARSKHCYSFCVQQNLTYSVNATLEYSASEFADRKYYLTDHQTNRSEQLIDLYLLNKTKASEVVLITLNSQDGEPVEGAIIKIQRYYPGQNAYKTVEIEKTDNNGKTLGKFVLADVFYKFIIEYPSGVIRYNSDIQKVLTLTKSFFLSITGDPLGTFFEAAGITMQHICVDTTGTCTFTWSNDGSVVNQARYKLIKYTGVSSTTMSDQSLAAQSGTLTYTISPYLNNTRYVSYAWINATDGLNYMAPSVELYKGTKGLYSNKDAWKASMILIAMLFLVIIAIMTDFGAVGVIIGTMVATLIGMVSTALPWSAMWASGFVIIGIILIIKVRKNEA